MEELINEKTLLDGHTAEADNITADGEEKVSLGKFKDVNALLKAYNSLEAEFTKRSQRLRELEGAVDSDKVSPEKTEGESEKTSITDKDKKEILESYLKEVLSAKQKAVLLDNEGVSVKAPIEKPKSITEAGNLAKEIF